MAILLVGFDSAWTPANSGALVGVLWLADGQFRELGPPRVANYREAQDAIARWQADWAPTASIVLLDQPTIVKNVSGQRPVENLVSSPVGLRGGGMQPANTARADMFGEGAPVWTFLSRFGGAADPLLPLTGTRVLETYPVLAMIALGWVLPDRRVAGRLPKYNPQRRTFSNADWKHVCTAASIAFAERGLAATSGWIDAVAQSDSPRKADQDGLDACLCLLVALHLIERKSCLMIGDLQTGYIVVPDEEGLRGELEERCVRTRRTPSEWVRAFRLPAE